MDLRGSKHQVRNPKVTIKKSQILNVLIIIPARSGSKGVPEKTSAWLPESR